MTTLLLLGVGNVASAVAQHAAGSVSRPAGNIISTIYSTIYGTTRNSERAGALRRAGIEPIVLCGDNSSTLREASRDAHVLVSFPPDREGEQRLAEICSPAARVIYISSTGVYGRATGEVDEQTPVDLVDPNNRLRIESEQIWQSKNNAIVLRAPGLYGPQYGLHLSLLNGNYRLPEGGNSFTSRIHLDDLAAIILQAFSLAKPGSTYVVGDKKPATQIEVTSWLCQALKLPLPASVPLSEVHHTLRSNRRVNSQRLLEDLKIELRYPTYVEGFQHCIESMPPVGRESGY